MNQLNIFQRMSKATEEIGVVAKNLMVETAKGKGYKAVSERDIIDAVKPIETKYGIYSYPASREILESHLLENESTYTDSKGNQTVSTKTTFMTRIKTVYKFVNIDNPSDCIEMTTFAEGIDSQDKGSGKGMTYGDKYALMKAYKISTGDDPDQNASEDTHYTTKSKKVEAKAEQKFFCVDCEKELNAVKLGDEIVSAEKFAEYTQKKFGKTLCPECAKRMKWVMENANNEGNAPV